MLLSCSSNLLVEALIYHLQRLRSRTSKAQQGQPHHYGVMSLSKPPLTISSINPLARVCAERYDKRLFGILADALIRDFHGASSHGRIMAVYVWINDLLLLLCCEKTDDLDSRMVRSISLELQRRMGAMDPMEPDILGTAADHGSNGSSREFEFVADHEQDTDDEHVIPETPPMAHCATPTSPLLYASQEE